MLRARYLPIYVMCLAGGLAIGWVFSHGAMDANDWFAVVMIVAAVTLGSAFAWDIIHPILEDKPQRQEFLDEQQVRTARDEAEQREYSDWFDELVADTHAVETDRIAKRARGECSCTVPDTGPENSLIADRRCPKHGEGASR